MDILSARDESHMTTPNCAKINIHTLARLLNMAASRSGDEAMNHAVRPVIVRAAAICI